MGLRDWLKRNKDQASSTASYAAMPDEALAERAAAELDWKPARTAPGVLAQDLSAAQNALVYELEKRNMAKAMMYSSSLGGPAYYATNDKLAARILEKPGYGAAKAELDRKLAGKQEQDIALVAAIGGWQSDYHGGYELTLANRGDLTGEQSKAMEQLFAQSLLSYVMKGGIETFKAADPRVVSAIEAHMGPGPGAPKRDANPGEERGQER